jgi:hypothetical protein
MTCWPISGNNFLKWPSSAHLPPQALQLERPLRGSTPMFPALDRKGSSLHFGVFCTPILFGGRAPFWWLTDVGCVNLGGINPPWRV